MKLLFLIGFLFIVNCKLTKIEDNHGVNFLEKKQQQLTINVTNANDVIELIGPPSTKSTFNNDLWIYIERRKTGTKLSNLGRKDILANNVLLLEFNSKGLLSKKELFNINDMKKIKFIEDETELAYSKKSFVYDFLSSMRQRMNDPLGVRKEKRNKARTQ